MYQVRKAPYGVHLSFTETVSSDEMRRCTHEADALLASIHGPFGVLVDERQLRPGGIPSGSEAEALLVGLQSRYKTHGMQRSCVILQSASVTMQMERKAHDSGIANVERYINAKEETHWETKALAWIEHGIDPD